jgi:CheY-like chemotaxis protein
VPARDGAQASARRRIVIVEDNDDVRRSLRQLLELAGHEVLEAVDGPAGVALIARERPDVALIDIGLPGLDGHGVARAVRARIGDTTRLVGLSGYAPPAENGGTSSFDAYLVKPVDPERLEGLLA